MKTPQQFYTELTAENLAKRKKPEHTKLELKYIKNLLNKNQRILDLGCGYGRFTIPLAKQEYDIKGIDITPVLIKKAREIARKQKVKIDFKIGDMKKLPYRKESFDAIVCMWTVFNELINKKDQLRSIKEMLRVLSKKGFALIEMPLPVKITGDKRTIRYEKSKDELVFHKKTHLVESTISGLKARTSYMHDKNTLSALMKEAKIKRFNIFADKFGGRKRFFLKFYK